MAITAGKKLGGYNESALGPGMRLCIFNLTLDGSATTYDTGHNLIWVSASEKCYDASETEPLLANNALTATIYDTASETKADGRPRYGTIELSGAGTATDEILVVGLAY